MTLTKLLKTLCLAGLCVSNLSCDDSDHYINYPDPVAVLNVEASTNFDLSARSNWKFLVHGRSYAFEIEGNKLTANPAKLSDAYSFIVTPTEKNGSAVITFMPADYFKTRSTGTVVPNIENQSTPEKFMACDVLRGKYEGLAKEEISITFFHENALLQFETAGLPHDARVYIGQKHDQTITPLRDKEDPNQYKAIVLPQNYPYDIYVIVKTNTKTYSSHLVERAVTRTDIPSFKGLGQSAVVNFKARITEEDKLIIEDYKLTYFDNAWPITQ